MKVIFLDFDGVMDTAYYDNYLNYMGLPEKDKYGVVFDPDCIANLRRIIDETGAGIVVSSTWKDFMLIRRYLKCGNTENSQDLLQTLLLPVVVNAGMKLIVG